MPKYIIISNKENFFNFKSRQNKYNLKIISIISFLCLYTIILIFIESFLFKKKFIVNPKLLQSLSKIQPLKLKVIEKAVKCIEKNSNQELCLYQYLCPKEVIGKTRILIGEKQDGSYVMLNDFENVKIAYSIGIRDIIQFDKSLADRGIDVYMYDHTIDKLPYENAKFHWKKKGIGVKSGISINIETLLDMLKENNHTNEKNMILKMDIEGAEWDSLKDLSENILNQFKYILIEYHFIDNDIIMFYNVLKKIYKTHQIFYVHCCPFAGVSNIGNNIICSALEVSYIIRDGQRFTIDKSIYPIPEFSYGSNNNFDTNILKLFDNYES